MSITPRLNYASSGTQASANETAPITQTSALRCTAAVHICGASTRQDVPFGLCAGQIKQTTNGLSWRLTVSSPPGRGFFSYAPLPLPPPPSLPTLPSPSRLFSRS